MRKVTSKKDEYTVECKSQSETADVLNYIEQDNDRHCSHWKYVTRLYNGLSDINDSIKYEHPVILFEEWKELPDEEFVLGKEKLNNKKIIGYKLVKEEYKEAVKAIINRDYWFHNFDINLKDKGFNFAFMNEKDTNFWASVHCEIKKSGVLDLWFEPVYEESTQSKIVDYLAEQGIEINKDCASEIIKIVNNK